MFFLKTADLEIQGSRSHRLPKSEKNAHFGKTVAFFLVEIDEFHKKKKKNPRKTPNLQEKKTNNIFVVR